MPTHFQSVTVVNLQKERKTPYAKGMINPIAKATMVGRTNSHQYFLIDFCIAKALLENSLKTILLETEGE